jgi:hypothetical protein
MSATPRVSVVITWLHGSASLEDMLRLQLTQHDPSADLDLIVVTPGPPGEDVVRSFPDLRFITTAADTPLSRMRSIGVQHALGDIVMLVDAATAGHLVERARELVQ